MFWRRSTKDIVVSRKRQREEEAAAQPSFQETTTDNPDAGSEAPVQNQKENAMMKKINLKWLWIVGGCACVLILALCVALARKPSTIPEGMSIVALQDTILADSAAAGDIIQVYNAEGAVIPQLQYVQVYSVTAKDGLLLALDPTQMAAYTQHETVTAALVSRSGAHAQELLTLQQQILYPQVTLQLPAAVTLEPGKTLHPELAVTTDPENGILPEITWVSSDPSVCSIDGGDLKAGEIGQAVVTASCGDASASCTITVGVSLTALQLNKSDALLAVGETLQLTAAPEPADTTEFTVSWVSSNPEIATVAEDGTITAVSSGVTTITASCADIHADCTVKVGVHTELVQLVQHAVILDTDSTLTLEYAVYPAENNIDSVSFSSSDPNVVEVGADGVVKAVGSGTATITITHGSATDTCTITVDW